MGEGFSWKGFFGGGEDIPDGAFIPDEPVVQRQQTEGAVAPVDTVEGVDRGPAMPFQGTKTERFTAEEMKSGVRAIVDSMKSTSAFFRAEDLMSHIDEIEKRLVEAGILKVDDLDFDYIHTLVRDAVREVARGIIAKESKDREYGRKIA